MTDNLPDDTRGIVDQNFARKPTAKDKKRRKKKTNEFVPEKYTSKS